MERTLQVFGLVFMSIACVSASLEFENRVRNCLRDVNANHDSCLISLLRDIKPRLREGIPEIKIPILEPYEMPAFVFRQKEDALNVEAMFRNLNIKGFSEFSVVDMKTDLNRFKLTTQIFLPRLRASGTYRLRGNIFGLRIHGQGPFKAILRNIKATVVSDIVRKMENGKERLGVANTKINFQLESASTMLKGLFDGDVLLGKTVNHFINNNDQLILTQVKPAVSMEMAHLIENVVDNAIGVLPLDIGQNRKLPPLHVPSNEPSVRFAEVI